MVTGTDATLFRKATRVDPSLSFIATIEEATKYYNLQSPCDIAWDTDKYLWWSDIEAES